MMKAADKARALARHLTRLEPRTLERAELARIGGAGRDTASSSRSGEPAASDDCLDAPDGGGGDIIIFDIVDS